MIKCKTESQLFEIVNCFQKKNYFNHLNLLWNISKMMIKAAMLYRKVYKKEIRVINNIIYSEIGRTCYKNSHEKQFHSLDKM